MSLQTEIWHRRYPPASVLQALDTDCGHPVPADDMPTFTGLDILLRARGWSFIRECSGPKLLTFRYPPSETGVDYLCPGLEPVSTVVVVPDRSGRPGAVANCKVEILLVGTPRGQAHFTSLATLTTLLGVIESHRPTAPTPLAFLPVGPAHV
ncbi:hypothetical protein [Nocardia jiangxiensis]|uniref:hypothetical protein n=1 Tax=Nocardia jiangxiensis TaxID=282685 RepID=UPI0012F6E80F|nr:hypothetical protein [Nocardia jiangxiensis]